MKKILSACIIFSCLLFSSAYAQDQTISSQLCIGGNDVETGTDLLLTAGGGFLVSGSTKSNHGDFTGNHGSDDFSVARLNAAGQLLWAKQYGGVNEDNAFAAAKFAKGFAVSGSTASNDQQVTGNHGNIDGWLILLNSNGNLVTSKCLGGSGNDQFFDIINTADGGFLLAGYSTSSDGNLLNAGGHGSNDVWLLKLNATAQVQWSKCYGGSGADFCRSVRQTSDGNYVAACYSYSSDGDVSSHHGTSGTSDFWIIKVDPSGNLLWTSVLGGTGSEYSNDLIEDDAGNIWVGGTTSSNDGDVTGNHGGQDLWIVRLSSLGTKLNATCFGGSGAETFEGGIVQLDNDHFLVSASSLSTNTTNHMGGYDVWLVNFDANGNLISDYSYGDVQTDLAYDAVKTTGGDVVVCGRTYSFKGDVSGYHGNGDEWFVKFSNTLRVQSSSAYASPFSAISVYPVPASDQVTINFPDGFDFSNSIVTLINESGRQMLQQQVTGKVMNFSIDELQSGVYFMRVSGSRGIETIRLLKQ